ncbi:hypothetical protein PV327_008082 [Microctonus hyperodae]|uniref:Uncharacterized protein n=1 Tax=Microctonus hyperodae TaxID=165561 RepID=A0AA39KGI0_MICHY|nr:hypothetical protein PV327_008082 [Microctonus hyperodae]
MLRKQLLNTKLEEDIFGGESSENEDHISEFENNSETEDEMNDLDDELECAPITKRQRRIQERKDELDNIPLVERLQQSTPRARPISK